MSLTLEEMGRLIQQHLDTVVYPEEALKGALDESVLEPLEDLQFLEEPDDQE